MWTCPKCSEQVEDQFTECWSCGTGNAENPTSSRPAAPDSESKGPPARVDKRTWGRSVLIGLWLVLAIASSILAPSGHTDPFWFVIRILLLIGIAYGAFKIWRSRFDVEGNYISGEDALVSLERDDESAKPDEGTSKSDAAPETHDEPKTPPEA